MSTRSPGAFLASLTLHAAFAGALVLFAYLANRQVKETPQIMELVRGEGDNYAATEAPAFGVPGGIKLDIPAPPPPAPSPVIEAAPEPDPAPSAPVEPARPQPRTEPKPKAEPSKPAPTDYKPVNMAKMVDRIADKRAANIEKKFRAEQAAAEAKAAKEAAAKEAAAKRMTKEEFDRQNKGKGGSSTPSRTVGAPGGTGPAVKRIDTAGIAGGVVGGSTKNTTGGAGGKALSREEIELSDAYIAMLNQRLKEVWPKPEGLSDSTQATVKFRLTSSGSVVNVEIVRSSGNAEFDQSVLAAFQRLRMPPPPAGFKTSDYMIPFRMKEES